MADRVERLTNLLAMLLETVEPLSLVEIAGELGQQYPHRHGARRAAFERDKAALREIGVPIEQEIVAGGEYAGQTRYWIDRDRYELSDLRLDDDEMRALQVAMAATRPGSESAQDALWKLGAGLADSGSLVVANLPELPSLPIVRQAIADRMSVAFGYRDVERAVDPWGLLLRDGFWYLIGFDHARGERRTFRIDRIAGSVERGGPATVDRPDNFDPRDALPDDPKAIGADGAQREAHVAADVALAVRLEAELGADRVVARRDDGSVEFRVEFANFEAFRSWLLGHLAAIEVLGPPEVRSDVIEWLEAVAS